MAARILLTALALVAGAATGAFAQSDRGTITGTVVDTDGGVVPGASVVAENPDNGARYETVTTQTGNNHRRKHRRATDGREIQLGERERAEKLRKEDT